VIRKSVVFGFTSFAADGNDELKAGARALAALCDSAAAGQRVDHVALAGAPRGPFEEIFRELQQYREVSAAAVEVAGRRALERRRSNGFQFFQRGGCCVRSKAQPPSSTVKLAVSQPEAAFFLLPQGARGRYKR
jgi:hypothetical protein